MWGGGEQDQVAVLILCQSFEQLETQLLASAIAGAGMCLVDDDAFGGCSQKLFTVPLALDVVQADHNHWVMVEQPDTMRQIAFDACCRG